MNRSINPLPVFLLASFALLLSSCSENGQEMIVGKWQSDKDGNIVEFQEGGKLMNTGNGVTIAGTYKFTDSSHVVLQMPINIAQPGFTNGVTMTVECALQFSGDDELDMDSIVKVPKQPDQKNLVHLKRIK